MNKRIINLSGKDVRLATIGERQFSGYASVFSQKNFYGFEIAKGAYDDVIAAGQQPLMFFGHASDSVPIGKWLELRPDEKGLFVVGELTEGIQLAEDVHKALVHGTLNGMSVGISYREDDYDETNCVLNRVETLHEISVVGFPADDSARITEALSAELEVKIAALASIKDIEGFLRDACGLSNNRAKQFLAQVKHVLAAQRDAEAKEREILSALERIATKL